MPRSARIITFNGVVFLLACATTPGSGQFPLPQPAGLMQWGLTGSDRTAYEVRGVGDNGHSMSLTRVEPPSATRAFGATAAVVEAVAYRGHSVRLRVQLRADSATGASSWLRIDGNGAVLAAENNMGNALRGTTAWTEQVTELDVPTNATHIIFGTILTGSGTIHAREINLEAFDRAAPTPAPAWRTDQVTRSSPFSSAATLWVRADGSPNKTLALQNKMERPIVGTTE